MKPLKSHLPDIYGTQRRKSYQVRKNDDYQEPAVPDRWGPHQNWREALEARQLVAIALRAAESVFPIYREVMSHEPEQVSRVEAALDLVKQWLKEPVGVSVDALDDAARAVYAAVRAARAAAVWDAAACAAARAASVVGDVIAAWSAASACADAAGHIIDVRHWTALALDNATRARAGKLGLTSADYQFIYPAVHYAMPPGKLPAGDDWKKKPHIIGLARDYQETEDPTYLRILADALADAGFPDEKMLQDLRHGKMHSKHTTWVIRELLG